MTQLNGTRYNLKGEAEEFLFDAPEVSPPSLIDYEKAIQSLIDSTARDKLFADGGMLAGYVTSTNPQWAAEAQVFVAWRDGVWMRAYAELAKVQAGDRAQPAVEEFLAEIDPIVWPEP